MVAPKTTGQGPRLANIVEVAVWRRLLCQVFLVSVQLLVQVELLLQQQQPMMTKCLDWTCAGDAQHPGPSSQQFQASEVEVGKLVIVVTIAHPCLLYRLLKEGRI